MRSLEYRKKTDEIMFRVFLTVAAVGIVSVGCAQIAKYSDFGKGTFLEPVIEELATDDNPIEEVTEEIINAYWGVDIDITPWSTED